MTYKSKWSQRSEQSQNLFMERLFFVKEVSVFTRMNGRLSEDTDISMSDVTTMKKSSIFHSSLK